MNQILILFQNLYSEAVRYNVFSESVTKMSASSTPRTPLRSLQPGSGDSLTTTPGGVVMDIVLTPALRPPPRYYQTMDPSL